MTKILTCAFLATILSATACREAADEINRARRYGLDHDDAMKITWATDYERADDDVLFRIDTVSITKQSAQIDDEEVSVDLNFSTTTAELASHQPKYMLSLALWYKNRAINNTKEPHSIFIYDDDNNGTVDNINTIGVYYTRGPKTEAFFVKAEALLKRIRAELKIDEVLRAGPPPSPPTPPPKEERDPFVGWPAESE